MTNKISLLSIATSLIFASCNLENYNPIVTVNVPSEAPSLVPNMYLEDGIEASMFVGKTQDVLTPNKNFLVAGAQIELFENEVLKSGWIKSNGVDTPFYYIPNFKPTPGNIYRTNVTAPNLPAAQAIDTMPLPVQFTVVKTGKTIFFEEQSGKGPFGGDSFADTLAEVKLTFTDNANAKNYYRILVNKDAFTGKSINQINYGGGDRTHRIHSSDIIYQNIGGVDNFGGGGEDVLDLNYGFFTDVTFNGKTKEIIFYVPIGRVPDYLFDDKGYDKAYFSLQHLSRSAYLHASSAINYSNDDELFSQPSLIFSNYKNGFGILGCNTATIQGIQVR